MSTPFVCTFYHYSVLGNVYRRIAIVEGYQDGLDIANVLKKRYPTSLHILYIAGPKTIKESSTLVPRLQHLI